MRLGAPLAVVWPSARSVEISGTIAALIPSPFSSARREYRSLLIGFIAASPRFLESGTGTNATRPR